MKTLFIGDIVGKLGREAVHEVLSSLRQELGVDLVFANAENMAHGRGATAETLREVVGYGVDAFTSGNHIFWRSEIRSELEKENPILIRPANYADDVSGKGFIFVDGGKGRQVLLINLLGRGGIHDPSLCPFRTVDKILDENKDKSPAAIIVDFHAEYTSEKAAMGWYLDGRVSAVIGTHTHVATADTWVMPQGTAFVSDAGMTGPQYSVLGVEPEIIIHKMKYPEPQHFEWVEDGPAIFNSVLVETDDGTGKAISIKRYDRVLDNI